MPGPMEKTWTSRPKPKRAKLVWAGVLSQRNLRFRDVILEVIYMIIILALPIPILAFLFFPIKVQHI